MMTPPNEPNSDICDTALNALADQLDVLGKAERGTPTGLEGRVLTAVAETLVPAPIAINTTPRWRSTTVKLAAGLCLAGVVAASFYVAQSNQQSIQQTEAIADATQDDTTTYAAVEERIDGIFAMGSLVEEDPFQNSLASIELWADALDAELSGNWQASEYTEDWFGEGAL